MNVSFFYNIIIAPIYDVLEFFYVFFSSVTSKGIAVISLSFAVTLFCLPLYIVAEGWQEEERKIQAKLKAGVDRIKQTFKGDEQYMILTTFYRENHYHPIMALRSSFSLLIQIPFFIAAYSFLSNVEALQGYRFLFISDFGAPDRTFMLGTIPINVLPIAMTLINVISGAIYSKGHALSEKVTIYASAAIFLVILYDSPAGLVVYWTMNNVLSLVKNVFYKLKNPKKVFHLLCTVTLFLSVLWAFKTGKKIYIAGTVILFLAVAFINQISYFYTNFISSHLLTLDTDKKLRDKIFWLSAFALAFLAGAVLPSYVIESSAANFCYVDSYKSPFIFIIIPFLQNIGLYLFWPACLYYLFGDKFKKTMAILWPLLFIMALVNCFVFEGSYGPMNDDLTFMHEVVFPSKAQISINLLAMLLIVAILLVILEKFSNIINYVLLIATISFAAVFVKNSFSINKTYKNMTHEEIVSGSDGEFEKIFHLSKSQKNLLLIMQDRCVGPVLHEVFEEHPELKEKFSGFTFYPNTVSMSYYTQLGAIGLFGGYDYTPFELNKRDDTIQKKHNEAILTLPTLFNALDWNINLADMPYENYGDEPVTQIYEGLENVNRHITKGIYTKLWYENHGKKPFPVRTILLKRNFLYLSLFKIALPLFRPMIYHRSWWITGNSKMKEKAFMDCYAPLDLMTELTSLDSDKPTLTMLVNEITHEPIMLQAPDYTPVEKVTDKGSSKYSDYLSYHTASSAMLRWAEFFDYLKENNVYDNTRIIIVSDHGDGTNSGKMEQTLPFNKEEVTATLMVKDFGAKGSLKEDFTFMTNADTPAIITEGIIDNAKNPFTGNELKISSIQEKNSKVKIAHAQVENLRSRYNKKYKIADSEWYTVHDDIYKSENWSKLYK